MTATSRRTVTIYMLLMIIFLSTASEIHADDICSDIDEKDECYAHNDCVYVRRRMKGKCIPKPSAGECDGYDAKTKCKREGCKWHRQKEKCYADGDNDEGDADRDIRPDEIILGSSDEDPDPTKEELKKPRIPEGVKEFLDSLIGTDKDDAIVAINNEFCSEYTAYICDDLFSNNECTSKDYDPKRVKLYTRDGKILTSYVVGNEGPDSTERIPEDIVEFLDSLIGTDRDDAIVAINDKFGSDYTAYICDDELSNSKCISRDYDPNRVKLYADDEKKLEDYKVG